MTTIQFLAEWALRSSILIVSGALLLWALRVKDPSIRWAAWTAMLCASLAIPALTAALPKLPLVVMRVAPARIEAPVMVYPVPEEPMPAVSGPDVGTKRPVVSVSKPFDWARAAVMVYVLVALGLLLRLCFGLAMSLRLLRSSRVTGQATEGIEIRASDRVATPVALGIARPAIVLPGDWREWDGDKLEAVLAHERSHIRRHDPALQLLSAIHRLLLWHSPLSWFLHRRIVRAAEEASDDAALAVTRDRALYAEMLLEFMQRGGRGAGWQGVPVARYGRADKRIHRILDGTVLSRGVTRWSLAAILAWGLPLAYVVAAAYPAAAPPPQAATAPAAPVQTADQVLRNVPAQSRHWTPFETDMVDRQYDVGKKDPVSVENYVYARRDDGSSVKFEQILPNGKRGNQRIIEDYSTRTRTSIDPSTKSLIKYHYSAKVVDDLSTPPRACSDSKAAHVEIQGYDTVEVRFVLLGPGKGFPATEWRAPRLNCFALKSEVVFGSVTHIREALDVKEGAPSDSLFEIPSNYTELPSKGLYEPKRENAQTESARPLKPGVVDGQNRIEAIEIRGNVKIPASTVRESIPIHPGDIYDPAKIERAVTALRNMGYVVREVTSNPPAGTKGGPVVIFYVHEKKDAAARPEAAALPSFEVGSIKLHPSGNHGTKLMDPTGGTVQLSNGGTKGLIEMAYNVQAFQVSGGPSWINTESYDIEAKIGDSVAEKMRMLTFEQRRQQFRLMIQSLLADRFKLRVSITTSELPVYALVIAKNGPKLHEADPGDMYINGTKGPDGVGPHGQMSAGSNHFTYQDVSMAVVAEQLSRRLGRTVLDQTGLKGKYDFTLQWTLDEKLPGPPGGSPGPDSALLPEASRTSILAAIQEQLGLELKSIKGPVEILVIDHIERPSAD